MDETNGHAQETEDAGSLDERTKLEKLTARLSAYTAEEPLTNHIYRSIVAQKMEELPRGVSDKKGKENDITGRTTELETSATPTTNHSGIQGV